MPKVSIIMPCYNLGQYIDEAIDSVFAQSFDDLEVVIVNDGSTCEKTNEKLSNLIHPKIKVIQSENQGLPLARNLAIKNACGIYMLPLDSDDKIGPTYVGKCVDVLDRDSDIGIVYAEAEMFGEKKGYWNLPEYSFPGMLTRNLIFNSAMYRKADWKIVDGYNANMKYGWEDWNLWLSIISLGRKVFSIPKILYYYRQRDNSMSEKQHRSDLALSYVQLYRNHESLYNDNIKAVFQYLIDLDKLNAERLEHIRSSEVHINNLHTNIKNLEANINNLEEDMKEKDLIVHNKDTYIKNLEDELNLIKNSKVWRTADFFRNFFYIKLLGKAPLLQQVALTISRDGYLIFLNKVKAYLKKRKNPLQSKVLKKSYNQ